MSLECSLPFSGSEGRGFVQFMISNKVHALEFFGWETGYTLKRNSIADYMFGLPVRTPITAVAEGEVLGVVRGPVTDGHHPYGEGSDREIHYMNSVNVRHELQGRPVNVTYEHVMPEVEKGDVIALGHHLGLLGGYARGTLPHMHISFQKPGFMRRALPVSFTMLDGRREPILQLGSARSDLNSVLSVNDELLYHTSPLLRNAGVSIALLTVAAAIPNLTSAVGGMVFGLNAMQHMIDSRVLGAPLRRLRDSYTG
jgi:hypothetical protein